MQRTILCPTSFVCCVTGRVAVSFVTAVSVGQPARGAQFFSGPVLDHSEAHTLEHR